MSRCAALVTAFALGCAGWTAPANATTAAAPPDPSILTVRGEGSVSRAPDRAFVHVTIVTNDDAAAKALSDNNGRYTAVVAKLAAAGVAAVDIKTTSLAVNDNPRPPRPAPEIAQRYGYIVTRALHVDISALEATGRVVDAVASAGATQIDGIGYGLRDPHAAQRAALAAAVEDATQRAQTIAAAAHVRIERIVHIESDAVPFRPLMKTMALAAAPSVPTELSPSDLEVRASVTIAFAIR